tara:strand:- start:989 stop:1270 length:282 start_codon:yes stop_codon:yes gene_type:complete
MKQVKRNKQKVWRKTYGKPFIAKESITIAECASSTAASIARLSVICAAHTDKFTKGLAIAQALLTQTANMNNILKISNKGFVKNERNNTANKV